MSSRKHQGKHCCRWRERGNECTTLLRLGDLAGISNEVNVLASGVLVAERIRSLTRIGIKGSTSYSGVVNSMRSSRPNHPARRKTATVCAVETQVADRRPRIHTTLARAVPSSCNATSLSAQKMTTNLTDGCAGTSSATTSDKSQGSHSCAAYRHTTLQIASKHTPLVRSFQAVTPTPGSAEIHPADISCAFDRKS